MYLRTVQIELLNVPNSSVTNYINGYRVKKKYHVILLQLLATFTNAVLSRRHEHKHCKNFRVILSMIMNENVITNHAIYERSKIVAMT